MRIVTWNINSLKARFPRVEEWIAENEPDVLCIQETKMTDDAFPALAFQAMGYDTVHAGQGQWNGVAILSRVGIDDVVRGFADGGEEDPEARLVRATCGGVRFTNVYVPNGRALDNDHYTYKLGWLERLRGVLDTQEDPASPFVILGDFNIAPGDDDVWDPAVFVDATHTSPPERAALARLEEWGLDDVFLRHWEVGDVRFSWWDYRGGNFHKGMGMRIDLVLATPSLAARTTSARVDRNARKGKGPSDHAPVVVEIDPA